MSAGKQRDTTTAICINDILAGRLLEENIQLCCEMVQRGAVERQMKIL